MAWKPFSFGSVELLTMDDEVASQSGIVYSTSPRTALDHSGETYFVKGPDREIVFAELAGCSLANAVGLNVPCAKACLFDGQVYAGTKRVSSLRAIEPYLRKPASVQNYYDVYAAILIDVWLGNTDRNMGNIVGDHLQGGVIEFVFIDFEKSAALRPSPIITSSMIDSKSLWPSNLLGDVLRATKPLIPPTGFLNAIERMDEGHCRDVLFPISVALGQIEWASDSVVALGRRSKTIQHLAEGVWNCA